MLTETYPLTILLELFDNERESPMLFPRGTIMPLAQASRRGLIVVMAVLAVVVPGLATVAPSAQASVICPGAMAVVNNGGGISLLSSSCAAKILDTPPYPYSDMSPKISPNGQQVAFVREYLGKTIWDQFYVVPVTGGTPVKVSSLKCGDPATVAWSPDSTELAVVCGVSSNSSGIYMVKADGSGTSKLVNTQPSMQGIAWCGTKLVFPYAQGMYTLNASDGSGLQQLWADPNAGFYENPVCSPNRKWVLFDQTNFTATTSNADIYAIPVSGGVAQRLTQGGTNSYPAVSSNWTMTYLHQTPDGQHVYMVNQWLGAPEVVLGTTEGFYPGDAATAANPPPPSFPVLGSPPPGPGTPSNCPIAKFFGVRGSGETSSDGGGYGTTVESFEETLNDAVHFLQDQPINYPAIAVGYAWQDYGTAYANSVAAGISALQTALITFWHKCPTSNVILAGYSQGAQVAGDVADTLTSSQRNLVAAVTLFGDPRFNPGQGAVDVSATGYDPTLKGIYQFANPTMRHVPTDLEPRFQSYCLPGDPICNFSAGNAANCIASLSTCPHLFYDGDGWTKTAAEAAANLLARQPGL